MQSREPGKYTIQLLDYLATHLTANVKCHSSAMPLNIHSDASYLSEPRARIRLVGYLFWDVSRKDDNI
jgi:hypothetical protein